jgi:hypothetical protein
LQVDVNVATGRALTTLRVWTAVPVAPLLSVTIRLGEKVPVR